MLVLRLVSLGPESAVQSLLSPAITSSASASTSTSTSTSTKAGRNGIERQENYGKNYINSNSNSNSNGTYESNRKNAEIGNNGNIINSKRGKRIVSVEQKMQRTAAQKLQAERLVLGHGIFDMGSTRMDGGDNKDGVAAAGEAKGESESMAAGQI